jgi:hypothetical protein
VQFGGRPRHLKISLGYNSLSAFRKQRRTLSWFPSKVTGCRFLIWSIWANRADSRSRTLGPDGRVDGKEVPKGSHESSPRTEEKCGSVPCRTAGWFSMPWTFFWYYMTKLLDRLEVQSGADNFTFLQNLNKYSCFGTTNDCSSGLTSWGYCFRRDVTSFYALSVCFRTKLIKSDFVTLWSPVKSLPTIP